MARLPYLLTFAWLLGSLTLPASAQTTGASTPPASLYRLDPWSRLDAARGRPNPSLASHQVDFQQALKHNFPHAVGRAGGWQSYAGNMAPQMARTFKGFTYEQSLVRRLNERPGPTGFRVAPRGHQVVDIQEFDRATGKTIRTYQVFGGAKARTAIEKLLVSDRQADHLIVAQDVYDQIGQAVRECEALHQAVKTQSLDAKIGNRAIRKRAAKGGLTFDESRGTLGYQDATLGRLGTGKIERTLGKRLMADPTGLTSQDIARIQVRNQVESHGNWRDVSRVLGSDEVAWNRFLSNLRGIEVLSGSARDGLNRSVRQALLLGATEDKVRSALAGMGGYANAEAGAIKVQGELAQLGDKAYHRQMLRARITVTSFLLVGAMFDYEMSRGDQDLLGWLHSGKGLEWGIRGTSALVATEVAGRLQKKMLQEAGQKVTSGMPHGVRGARFRVRAAGLGAATAIFLAGEGLVGALQGQSGAEVADRMKDATLVLIVAEGSVWAAEGISVACGFGSLGGPLGIGIAVGATLAYEGVKYAWTASKEKDADHRIFLTRCELAREKVEQWSQGTRAAIGSGTGR